MIVYPLETIVALARARSPWYRDLYADVADDGWALADLPLVNLADFWAANTSRGNRILTAPLRDGIVFKSGGTTGAPKFSAYTKQEWSSFTHAFGRGLVANGLRDGDRVANLFYAGELYASFLFIMKSLEEAEMDILHLPLSGRADSDLVRHTIEDFAVNVVVGVPTTLITLAETLSGLGTALPSVERIHFGGESLFEDQRPALARAFPNAAISSIGYASVDAGLLGYADPICGNNEHRAFDRETIIEIIDEDSGQPIHEMNRPGKVAVTSLFRLLMPIIRYPAGDRAMWVEPEGTPNRRFALLGRSEESARIGPITLYLEDIRQILKPWWQSLDIINFQLAVSHHSERDQLTLRIARHGAAGTPDREITEAVYRARPMFPEHVARGQVHPLAIEWVHPAELAINPRTGKLRSVVDERIAR